MYFKIADQSIFWSNVICIQTNSSDLNWFAVCQYLPNFSSLVFLIPQTAVYISPSSVRFVLLIAIRTQEEDEEDTLHSLSLSRTCPSNWMDLLASGFFIHLWAFYLSKSLNQESLFQQLRSFHKQMNFKKSITQLIAKNQTKSWTTFEIKFDRFLFLSWICDGLCMRSLRKLFWVSFKSIVERPSFLVCPSKLF